MGRAIGVLFVLCSIAVSSALFTAKGFYCRDPDTGKLYPVNTTWPSSSFCGSYTCKLRKKNNTVSDEPLRTLKIGNVDQTPKETPRIVKHEGNCTRPIGVVIEPSKSNIQNILHKEKTDDANYVSLDNFKNIELNSLTKDGDRYLTEQEIKALTMLLHTVKKSDLEAILEIYDLAQDIYKEADRVGEDELVFQNTNVLEEEKPMPENKPTVKTEVPAPAKVKNYVSYWYEPLTSSNNKHSIDINPALPTAKDSNEIKAVPIKPKESIHESSLPKFKSNAEAYFSRALTNQDFRMLPYYFPMSKFNRQSSYLHANAGGPPVQSSNLQGVQIPQLVPIPQPVPIPQTNTMTRSPPLSSYPLLIPSTQLGSKHIDNILAIPSAPNSKPCKHPEGPIKKISPWYKLIKKPFIYDPENKQYDIQRRPVTYTESRINAQTLHYPFAYLNYNLSNLQNLYVNEYPWSFLNLHKDYQNHHHHHHPQYLRAAYMPHIPHAFLINQDLPDDSIGEEQKPVVEQAEKKMPDWQTEPLPMSILNEVRANMANTKLLPFPFRKKVNLEKVSKVIKMDDLSRSRRHANVATAGNSDEFEVYLEKSTCATDTEPGFFRMGNATEPFPACCPQRIGS